MRQRIGKCLIAVVLSCLLWTVMVQRPTSYAHTGTVRGPLKSIKIESDAFKKSVVKNKVYQDALKITLLGEGDKPLTFYNGKLSVTSGTVPLVEKLPAPVDGVITLNKWTVTGNEISVSTDKILEIRKFRSASWLSLLPPLIAIGLALWFRQVIVSLFGGIWLGNALISVLSPNFDSKQFVLDGFGFLPALSDTMISQLADADHMSVILFTLLMGGMVGVIAASGSMRAIVDLISKKAKSPRSAQLSTMGMGIAIFFDDYANTILVGNTMRPFTDRFRVSREKLAYIVDSTAAPVAALFLISTWIGYEVGLIGEMLEAGDIKMGAYNTFLYSVPYRFYSIFGLLMVFIVAFLGRDFGPMLAAEQRARQKGQVLAPGAKPLADDNAANEFSGKKSGKWWVATVPILVMILTILGFLFQTGSSDASKEAFELLKQSGRIAQVEVESAGTYGELLPKVQAVTKTALGEKLGKTLDKKAVDAKLLKFEDLRDKANMMNSATGILSKADPYGSLVYGAGYGSLAAIILVILGGFMSLEDTMTAYMNGIKSMLLAVVVLTLAWSLGKVCKDLSTGEYLAELIRDISPALLPTLVFLLSAAIAVATGTSWGTMAIVFPILGPLLGAQVDNSAFEGILFGSVGAVLAGSCFGDHASPISDTTVLSSMSSGSDHIDHVRTQLPYAVYAATIAILFGFLPAGFGLSPWIGLVFGGAALIAGVRFFGKRPEDPIPKEGSSAA
ncbi:MAG: Na+/H+ antiporter NhaC family protein [Planctomycetota bacterium]|nr:Na+/H+ antiporter NhaC family protein [Planctomycetota bacterium]